MNKSLIKANGFECTQCKKIVIDGHKHDNEEDICDQCKIVNLEKQLAITEKALELACLTISKSICPNGNWDTLKKDFAEEYKEQAKEMLENEKRKKNYRYKISTRFL